MMPLLLAGVVTGCGAPCVEAPDGCDPLYEPTFDNVYTETLRPTCGVGGGSCHSVEGGNGGLVVSDDIDATYDSVLAKLEPGDAECSQIVRQLGHDGADSMPPGDPLSDVEFCAIRLWVAEGANR